MSTTEYAGVAVPDDLRDLTEARSSGLRSTDPMVVVRHVAPVSVARLAVVFSLCGWAAGMVALTLLWLVASGFGVIGNVESFLQDVGFDGFQFVPMKLFGAAALAGLVTVAVGTSIAVGLALLFNVISGAVGGLHVTLADDLSGRTR